MGGSVGLEASARVAVGVSKRPDGRWEKPCPSCGVMQDYLRHNYAVESLRLGKVCKACSNRETENSHRGFVGPIRASWINKVRVSAETRGLTWSLDDDFLVALYERQGGRCALTGWEIGWADVGQVHTASLDRIDSDRGYEPGNVQFVHADVNMMKQAFPLDRFLEVCRAVTRSSGS